MNKLGNSNPTVIKNLSQNSNYFYNNDEEQKNEGRISFTNKQNEKFPLDNRGKSTAEDSYVASATDKQNEKIPVDNKEKSPAEDIFELCEQNITKKNLNPKKSIKKKVLPQNSIFFSMAENDGRMLISDRLLESEKSDRKDINPPNSIFYRKREENDGHMLILDELFFEIEKSDKEDEKNIYFNMDFNHTQNDNNLEESLNTENIKNVQRVKCNNKKYG